MLVTAPQPHTWLEQLPGIYSRNPKVAVVMAPVSWTTRLASTKDGKYELGFLISPGGTYLGLQVVDTRLDSYIEHVAVFREYGFSMASPEYIGPLADIPNRLLLDADRSPLAFCHRSMWRNYVDLKRCWPKAKLKC